MRLALFLTLGCSLSLTAGAEIRFISPLAGAQTFGRSILEITSTETPERVDFLVDGTLVGVARKAPYRVAFDFGEEPRARTITARAYRDHFQIVESATVTTLGLTSAASINVDLVEVPFRGRFRQKPTPQQLTIRESGKPQQIVEIRADRSAASFVFVLDRSLSMAGPKLEAARRGIKAFLSRLRSDDAASLILFNHRPAGSVAISSREIDSIALDASGGTSLRDALVSIHPQERTYVIVISDGSDRNSLASAEHVLGTLARRNVSVYGVLLGDGNAEPLLSRLADSTAGLLLRSDSAHLTATMQRLLSDIDSHYTAFYQSSSESSGWRPIEVSSNRGTIDSWRKGYFAK